MSKLKSNFFCGLGRQLEKNRDVLTNYPQDINSDVSHGAVEWIN